MGHPRAIVRLACAAAAVAASTATARGDAQYALKLSLAPDQQWSFQQTSAMSMSVQVGGGQQMQQSADQKRVGTVTVLSVKDGAPTALKVAFAADSGQSATQNGQPQGQPFPLAGKTVRVKKDDLGIVEIDGADADPPTTAELTNMLTPDRSLFPPHPVAVGDGWAGDAAALAKQMGLGPSDTVTVTCKLARIGAVDGRPTADVAVNVVGTKTENGVATKMSLDGTARADLATGQTLQADLAGTMDISGQAGTPNGPQAIVGSGKLEMHQTVRPVAGVAVPVVAAPAPDRVPAGGGGANPLAAPAADRFAGTFKNERIVVQLQPAADGYAGTITMGNQKFPATARPDGDRLAGTFESGGHKFDFTATLAGTTLQMASGQNSFTLQKDAPANPLDALGGGPANPLAPR